MDNKTAWMLNDLTCDFYRRQAASFSETRQRAWDGWTRVLDEVRDVCTPGMSALDLGCGNLRFERFLAHRDELRGGDCTVYAVDNCTVLAQEGHDEDDDADTANAAAEATATGTGTADATSAATAYPLIRLQELDVVGVLLDGADLAHAIDAPTCDLSVAFGFLHHVPGAENRERVLRTLIGKTRPGGFVVVSFWQFLNDEGLRAKTDEATARGCEAAGIAAGDLDEGDRLLGWQQETDVFRYCHHFAEDEVDALANDVSPVAREAARFSADGGNGALNRYLVLRVI